MKSSFFDFEVYVSPPKEITLDGQHQKKLTIINNYSADADEQIGFLRKILAAVKFDLETDTHFIQLDNKQKWQFVGYQKQYQPDYCLSFGVEPLRLGLQFNTYLYQPFSHAECTFLFAHSLTELQKNVNHKGLLWNCLQQLFLS